MKYARASPAEFACTTYPFFPTHCTPHPTAELNRLLQASLVAARLLRCVGRAGVHSRNGIIQWLWMRVVLQSAPRLIVRQDIRKFPAFSATKTNACLQSLSHCLGLAILQTQTSRTIRVSALYAAQFYQSQSDLHRSGLRRFRLTHEHITLR